jgi:hypothetical protein
MTTHDPTGVGIFHTGFVFQDLLQPQVVRHGRLATAIRAQTSLSRDDIVGVLLDISVFGLLIPPKPREEGDHGCELGVVIFKRVGLYL